MARRPHPEPDRPPAGTGPDAGFLELTPLGASGQTAAFGYPPGFPAGSRITQRFLFYARDVIQNQNSMGGIYVTRNDDLISSGPLGSATGPQGSIPTNPAFVYQTPLITFIDRLTPFVVDPSAINIAGLTGPSGKRTLAQHIETMLDAVLELATPIGATVDNHLSMLCSYGFVVAADLVAKTPIRLVPAQLLTAAGKAKFASDLSASIKHWPGWPGSSDTGMLILDVSVFTNPGPTGPDPNLKPILEFENLRVSISDIGDKT